MPSRAPLWIACLLCAACAAPASPRAQDAPLERIDVHANNRDLADLMDELARRVGRTILVDPTVQEAVTVRLRDIPWREAVDVIARMTRCEVEERPHGVLVLAQCRGVVIADACDADARTVLQLLAAYAGYDLELPDDLAGRLRSDDVSGEPLPLLRSFVAELGPWEVDEVAFDRLRVVPARERTVAGDVLGHDAHALTLRLETGQRLDLRLPPPSASGPEGARRDALLATLAVTREGDRVTVHAERAGGAWWLREVR